MTRADLLTRYAEMSRVLADRGASDAAAAEALAAFKAADVPPDLEGTKEECVFAAARTVEWRDPRHCTHPSDAT
jgi:hypothetical protein